jgi:hypothetical protein
LSDILDRRPPPFDRRITYGPRPQHFAELRFPRGHGPFPLLLMIHGGFWQSAYDLKHTGLLCADLTGRGIVTCNLEYRRIGDQGGGWPGNLSRHQPRLPQDSRNSQFRSTCRHVANIGHGPLSWRSPRWLISSISDLRTHHCRTRTKTLRVIV